MSSVIERPAEDVGAHIEGVLSRGTVLIGSKVGTWFLAFVMTVLLPRYLGATGFGRLYFAISLTAMASIAVEFGMNALVARDVARTPEEATRYLVNAAVLKASLWTLAVVAVEAVVHLGEYAAVTRSAVTILAVSMLLTSMSTLIVAVLQATDRIRWVGLSALFEKAVYVALGAGVLLLGRGAVAVSWAILAAAAAKLLLDLWWLRRLSSSVRLHSPWRGLEVGSLLRRALPFFSVLFFGAIYFRVDVVIMSLLADDATVGRYGAAYRLFETTNLVPEALVFSFFPVFCRLAKREDGTLAVAAQKSVDLLLLLGIPLATGMAVLAERIVGLLYGVGGYQQSILVLRVLAPAIVLMYANGTFMQLLIATDRQRRLVVTAAVAAAVNISVNLALIPRLGGVGAAVATVVTECVVVAMNYSFLPGGLTAALRFKAPLKAAAASLLMAAALLGMSGRPLPVVVATGVAVYGAAIVGLRALPREDWAMVRRALVKLRTA